MARRKPAEGFFTRTPPPGTFVSFTAGETKAYRALLQSTAEMKEIQLSVEAELHRAIAANRKVNTDFWAAFRKRTGILPTEVTAGTVTSEGVTTGQPPDVTKPEETQAPENDAAGA